MHTGLSTSHWFLPWLDALVRGTGNQPCASVWLTEPGGQHHVQYNRLATGEFLNSSHGCFQKFPFYFAANVWRSGQTLLLWSFRKVWGAMMVWYGSDLQELKGGGHKPHQHVLVLDLKDAGERLLVQVLTLDVWCQHSERGLLRWTWWRCRNRHSPSMTLPISRKEGGGVVFLELRLSFHFLWHLQLSWVRPSSAEVWEKGQWSKRIQSDGEQNTIWKWPTKRSQANYTLKALEVLKVALSLWQAEPTYLDDELNDGPSLSDMICWTIWTSPDRELQSRNPQGFDGNQSAGYPSGP